MGNQTFTLKDLRFTFTLPNATFTGTNSNTLTVNGLRATASIKAAGFPAFPEAEFSVYGLLQADMISLTALAFQPDAMLRATVMVEASSGGGWSVVFLGQIITAGPDYREAPAVKLMITARALGYESLAPADATSYTGPTDVALICANLVARMSRSFENNGVQLTLNSPYFSGTLAQQLRTVQQHANIDVYMDGDAIAICPKGKPRQTFAFVLSPTSGLVGYPVLDYQRGYVLAKAIFNPGFRFGGPIIVQDSLVKNANGSWIIGVLSHNLESLMPGGAWFSEMLLYPPGAPLPT